MNYVIVQTFKGFEVWPDPDGPITAVFTERSDADLFVSCTQLWTEDRIRNVAFNIASALPDLNYSDKPINPNSELVLKIMRLISADFPPSEPAVGGEAIERLINQWRSTLSESSTVSDEDAEDLMFRLLAQRSIPAFTVPDTVDDEHKVVRSKDVMDALSDTFDELGKLKMPANQVGLEVYRKLARVPEFYAEGLTEIAVALRSGKGEGK